MAFNTGSINLHLDETSPEDAALASKKVARIGVKAVKTLPPSVTLTGLSDVKNQGSGPYCASFATVAALEFKFQGKDLAECSLIRNVEQSIGKIMNFALQRGVCSERQWPYDLAHAATKPCADRGGGQQYSFDQTLLIYQEPRAKLASPVKASSSASGPKSNLLRRHLATVATPAVVEVPALDGDGYKCGWDTGDVMYPKTLDRAKAIQWATAKKRWHAVVIFGYDDKTQAFVFKNSWGGQWGHGGFGTMTYLYVDQLSPIAMAAT